MALISQACAMAFHAVMVLPEPGRKGSTIREMAADFNVSETHLAKVLQALARRRLVVSRRGPRGGFALAREASAIRMQEVFEAVDGAWRAETCLLGHSRCVRQGRPCCFEAITGGMSALFSRFLADTCLADVRSQFATGETT